MRLEFISGPKRGEELPVPEVGELVFGREAPCHVILNDEQLSRRHARIVYINGAAYIEDLESTNGVLLNGMRIHSPQPLTDGDRLTFGSTECLCRAGNLLDTRTGGLHRASTPDAVAEAALGAFAGDRPRGVRPTIGKVGGNAAGDEDAEASGEVRQRLVHPALLAIVLCLVSAATVYILWPSSKLNPATTGAAGGDSTVASSSVGGEGGGAVEVTAAPGSVDESADDSDLDPDPDSDSGDATLAAADPTDTAVVATAGEAGGDVPETGVAEAPPAPATPTARYLWLDTRPGGATVLEGADTLGVTPLLVRDLADGPHSITFRLDGYADLTRSFILPGDGERQLVSLRQQNGTVRVTSDPPGATILYGSQVLGFTPTILSDVDHRQAFDIRLILPYHEIATAKVVFDATRPNETSVVLKPTIGSLVVSATPANAVIYVDDFAKDRPADADAPVGRSAPVRFTGLKAGEHSLFLEVKGVRSEPVVATVETNGSVTVDLLFWLPDRELTLVGNRKITGMYMGDGPADAQRLMLANEKVMLYAGKEIIGQRVLDFAETLRLRDEAIAEKRREEMRLRLEEIKKLDKPTP